MQNKGKNNMKKIFTEVKTSKGKIGRKYFENRIDALNWLDINSTKLSEAVLVEEFNETEDSK